MFVKCSKIHVKKIDNASLKRFLVISENSKTIINLEYVKSAHNYHLLPIVLTNGKGVNVCLGCTVDGKVIYNQKSQIKLKFLLY